MKISYVNPSQIEIDFARKAPDYVSKWPGSKNEIVCEVDYLKRCVQDEAYFAFLCGLHVSCCKCATTPNPLYLEKNGHCGEESLLCRKNLNLKN